LPPALPQGHDACMTNQPGPSAGERFAYEGCAAVLRHRARKLVELRLLPLDLRFDAEPGSGRGRPRWAELEQGRRIIARIAARSRSFGTRITFDSARNEGLVEIARARVACPGSG
jgi:hypothetical protein